MKPACQGNPGRPASLWTMPLLSGLLLSSCSTTEPRAHTPHQGPGSDWIQVSSHPPIWFPRGVPADSPTGYQNGEWVYAGNSEDTRYFIPFRGLPPDRRAKLRNEALAARSPDKMNRILREDSSHAAKECATALFYLSPPGWLVAMGKASYDPSKQGSGVYSGFGAGQINPSSLGNLGNCAGLGAGGCNVGGGGH